MGPKPIGPKPIGPALIGPDCCFAKESSNPMQPPRNLSRLSELDALRGIAAVAVVLCHYFTYCRDWGRTSFDFRWGAYGPHLFFIISGFVILMSVQRCNRPWQFAWGRCTRLYPMYWLAVLLSTTLINFWHPLHDSVTPVRLVANLTMLQTWLGVQDIEVAYWTLGVELKFYALMFLLLCLRKTPQVEAFSLCWLLCVVGYRLLSQWLPYAAIVATPLIVDYAHLFVAGMMFYRLMQQGSSWFRHGLIAAVVPMAFWAEGWETALMSSTFLIVFYLFVNGRLTWIATRTLTSLGRISYALYLVHGSIGAVLVGWLQGYPLPLWCLIALPLCVALGVAWLLTDYFERPALAAIRGWTSAATPAKHPPAVPQVSEPLPRSL